MLLNHIKFENLDVKVRASSWKEAITLAAMPLKNDGAIEQRYIDEIIQSVERNGPYFILTKGVALAHARPDCGVHRVSVNFTLFDPPVYFNVGSNDPIILIITLAAINDNNHIELLGELAEILMNEERLDRILSSTSSQELYQLLIE